MNWTFHFNPASRDLWIDPIYTNNINIFVYLYGEISSGARIGNYGDTALNFPGSHRAVLEGK